MLEREGPNQLKNKRKLEMRSMERGICPIAPQALRLTHFG